jgi:hypothetical protein
MTPSDFDSLLDWLQARELTGTRVETMEEVMTGQASQDTTPPVTQIKCNNAACQSGFYNQNVSVTLNATDSGGSGLKEIRYTTDGSNPTTLSPKYTGAITVSSTTTIKYRAWDNAGNAEATKQQSISIDKVLPSASAIQCNGTSCQSGFYKANVQATFSGSDSGGSTLNGIRYTTDNATPSGSSPLYVPGTSSPVSVGSTSTIKFRAQDKAGNLETTVHSQAINIDKTVPTSSILCGGAACQASYDHAVNATLSATDTGGSGLKNIRYTTDGSDPTGSSPVYTAAIPVGSTTTIKWRAEDNAGNVESPANSQTIEITSPQPPPPTGGDDPGGAGATLGAFSSFKSLPNGRAKLTVEVTGPGVLEALDGAVTKAAAIEGKKLKHRIKRTSKSVVQAGLVTLRIKPSKAGRRILRRKGKLAVPVRVIFTPASGSQATQTIKLKLRLR